MRYLAARIKAARKILWVVHGRPLATFGRRLRSRARYTRDVMRVGTCTFDFLTKELMKRSREGRFVNGDGFADSEVGVTGGEGGNAEDASHWMTSEAFCAKYEIICGLTG